MAMTKLKVGITPSSFAGSNQAPLNVLESIGVEVFENPYKRRLSEDEAFKYLADKDGLIAGLEPLTRKVLSHAHNLKAIARVGIGMDNIDMNAAQEMGIKISNTPDGPTNAVAELTVAAALTLTRKIVQMNKGLHEGRWPKTISRGLCKQKILFIGYGRIGRKTAEFMRNFGAEILVYDPFVNDGELKGGEIKVSLDEGLGKADIISLNANSRKTILGSEQFMRIKNGAILLNSARGELVDENALINAIESGKVSAGWFDSFWEEPYCGRLLDYENMLLTPHVGTYTEQCRLSMEMDAVNNLVRDLGLQ